MKAFVIRDKKTNKYMLNTYVWTEKLCNAYIFSDKLEAEELINYMSTDCKVVEITITEGDLEKEIEHWHNLFKHKEQQFQSVRERYHLLNRLQANYDKKYKLHLSEMQCLELVEKNEDLEQQLSEKDKEISTYKEVLETYKKKPVNIYQVEIRNLQVDKAELKLELEDKNKQLAELKANMRAEIKEHLEFYEAMEKNLRKQTCKEIRERIENDFEYDCEYTYGKLIEIIDQVEKGEQQ